MNRRELLTNTLMLGGSVAGGLALTKYATWASERSTPPQDLSTLRIISDIISKQQIGDMCNVIKIGQQKWVVYK